VIHLDLKPANIFLTGEGRFKIGDFGMASLWPRPRPSGDGGGGGGSFEREGDKLYLAPEVLQGKYGKAADMFRYVLCDFSGVHVLTSRGYLFAALA
jgi:mitosis inhibitor protein kinase SWE1